MPRVYRGALSGRFYYAPTVRKTRDGVEVVGGRKTDITHDLLPYLKKRYIPKELLRCPEHQIELVRARNGAYFCTACSAEDD